MKARIWGVLVGLLISLSVVSAQSGGWVWQNNGSTLTTSTPNSASAVTIWNKNSSGCTLTLKTGAAGTTALSVCGTTITVPTGTSFAGVDSIVFSGGQALTGTTADVTTLSRSTNSQRFVLGLATSAYPALLRSGTVVKVVLGDGSVNGFLQVGRGSASEKSMRFVRGNNAEEATFGFHTDATNSNNLVFGVSHANRVVLSNTGTDANPTGVIVASTGAFSFSSTTDAAAAAVGAFIKSGAGDPEGVVTANVGSVWLRTDGSTSTTLYVKTSGTGNTGWTAK